MQHSFWSGYIIFTVWLGMMLSLSATTTSAQAPRPLRYVKHLRPVPPPPGGLIPYRKGGLWGYADTMGRVVLTPSLTTMPPCISDPLQARSPKGANQQSARTFAGRTMLLDSYFDHSQQAEWFVNGAGEVLAFNYRKYAAILQPDGSLRLRRRTRCAGQREVLFWDYTAAGKPRRQTRPVAAGRPWVYLSDLGAGRWASQEINAEKSRLVSRLHSANFIDREYYRPFGYSALLDTSGRQLTPYQYESIGPFRQGRAVFRRAGHYGYLDRAGREVVPPLYDAAQDFARGWARVGNQKTVGLVDTLGRFWQVGRVSDEARLVRHGAPGGGVRYLRPDGQVAFAGEFDEAAGFTNGRAWVRRGRRTGLIDESGRWVTTSDYDDLRFGLARRHGPVVRDWNSTRQDANGMPIPEHDNEANGQLAGVDTAYMQFRRAGKVGFLRRHTGQEVIAARYDSVGVPLLHNVATLWRGGVAYLVTGQGQELGAGQLEHVYPVGGRRYFYLRQAAGWVLVDSTRRVYLASSARLPFFNGLLPGPLAAVATAEHCGVPTAATQYSGPQACAGAADWQGRWVIPAQYAAVQAMGPYIVAEGRRKRAATACGYDWQQLRATVFDSAGRQLTTRPYWDARYLPGNSLLSLHSQGLCLPADTLVLLNLRGRELLRLAGGFTVADAPPEIAPALRRRFVRVWSCCASARERSYLEGLGYLSLSGRRFWED